MAIDTDALSRIRVLVCLADADQGTALAHALREHDFDVLVAHHIRSAMRVMKKESPQAVIVEVATSAYDGFRVAQWAQGRVRAIFLVAGRQLTMMEDVEVLTSGAKELFYTPLQSETIAASIRAACAPDAKQTGPADESEPRTQYSPASQQMESHAAHTVRSVSIIDPSAKTEAVSAVKPSDLAAARDTVQAASVITMEGEDYAPTQVQGQFARRPDDTELETQDTGADDPQAQEDVARASSESPEAATPLAEDTSSALVADLFGAPMGPTVIDPSSLPDSMVDHERDMQELSALEHPDTVAAPRNTPPPSMPHPEPTVPSPVLAEDAAKDQTSAALVDDLFGPSDTDVSTPEPEPVASTAEEVSHSPAPVERNLEPPPDDAFLMSGVLDELDELSASGLDSPEPSTTEAEHAEAEHTAAAAEGADDDQKPPAEEVDKQSLPTEIAEGPATVDLIAAAYGTSSTPKWAAQGLLAAVICASGWVGWLAVERLAPATEEAVESEEASQASEEETARSLLHSTLGEAAIDHRDGDFAKAKTGYKEALKQDENNQVALRGLIAIAMQQSDWSEARKTLNDLAKIAPDDPTLPLQQALVLNKLEKRPAALAEFLRFIDSNKADDPRVRPAAQVYLSLTEKSAP